MHEFKRLFFVIQPLYDKFSYELKNICIFELVSSTLTKHCTEEILIRIYLHFQIGHSKISKKFISMTTSKLYAKLTKAD